MAGAVGRVMNVERARLILGVCALRGAAGQRDPVLGCREGRQVRLLVTDDGPTSSHSGLRRSARSPRRPLRTSTEAWTGSTWSTWRFPRRTRPQRAAFNRKSDTRCVHAPLFAITSAADRIAVGSLRTYRLAYRLSRRPDALLRHRPLIHRTRFSVALGHGWRPSIEVEVTRIRSPSKGIHVKTAPNIPISSLRADLDGRVIAPDDPRYDDARAVVGVGHGGLLEIDATRRYVRGLPTAILSAADVIVKSDA